MIIFVSSRDRHWKTAYRAAIGSYPISKGDTLMGNLGPTELILILLVVVIFFGAKKIPELAQGLGKGIKEFKKATKEIEGGMSDARKID